MIDMEYYKKHKINDIQALHLELIRGATFNNYDGDVVVGDLINNRKLWKACLMIRDIGCEFRHHIPPKVDYLNSDLIPLRDMPENYWNVDTLYVIVRKEKLKKFIKMTRKWAVDDRIILKKEEAESRLGSYPTKDKVVRLWWD